MKDVFDFKSQLYRESEGKKLISVEGRIETWGTYREVCLLCAKCCTKYICKCSHWIHFSNPLLHSKVAEAHLKVKLSYNTQTQTANIVHTSPTRAEAVEEQRAPISKLTQQIKSKASVKNQISVTKSALWSTHLYQYFFKDGYSFTSLCKYLVVEGGMK